jgi:hypothetical protein
MTQYQRIEFENAICWLLGILVVGGVVLHFVVKYW